MVQLWSFSKSKNIKLPNTTKMETSGIMELIPSILPRLASSPQSVIQALKPASLAEEPKKVMTQSIRITRVTPREAAAAVLPAIGVKISMRMRQKDKIEMPHKM